MVVRWLLWGLSRSGSCCGGCSVVVMGGVLGLTPGLPFHFPLFLPHNI